MKLQRFDAPAKLKLDDIPTDPPDSMKKGEARDRFDKLSSELFELQDVVWGTLAKDGCIVLKFFLHITKEEQRERLLGREKDPNDAWKLSVEDWKDRERWDDYTEAYQDAIGRCASKDAPWIVVPANAKWYRNLLVAEAVAAAMRPHRTAWRQVLDEQGKLVRRDLRAWRAEHPESSQ